MNQSMDKPVRNKYATGFYAVCLHCGARPCVCDELPATSAPAEEQPEIVTLTAPRGRKSIPYYLWDHTIPELKLRPAESIVLAFLCRRTFGWGRYHGDYISTGEVAKSCNLNRSQARRVLVGLQRKGLVTRIPQGKDEKGVAKEGYLGVIIPGYWPHED